MKKRLWICLSILLVMCMFAGCQKSPAPAGNSTPTPTIPLVITVLPTFTPTPVVTKTPINDSVSIDAASLLPSLSGSYENVWDGYEGIELKELVRGNTKTKAEYKVIWTADHMYVQVHVIDKSPDVSAENYLQKDSVVFYLNENGKKSKVYANGDAFYAVDRESTVYLGTGCDGERFQAVAYEDKDDEGKTQGYYVEVSIPFLTIRAKSGTVIGFDVRVNNAEKGKLKGSMQWSDTSLHTDANLRGIGLLTLE